MESKDALIASIIGGLITAVASFALFGYENVLQRDNNTAMVALYLKKNIEYIEKYEARPSIVSIELLEVNNSIIKLLPNTNFTNKEKEVLYDMILIIKLKRNNFDDMRNYYIYKTLDTTEKNEYVKDRIKIRDDDKKALQETKKILEKYR